MNFRKPTTCLSPKFNFGEKHVVRFWKFKKFMNTFDYLTAGNPRIRPIFGVSSLNHLHCKTTKAFNFCIFLHSYVNLFIVWPIPNTKNTILALKVVIWKLGQMGLECILYLGVCLIKIHLLAFVVVAIKWIIRPKTFSKYVRHLGLNSFNVSEISVGRWKSGFVTKNRQPFNNQNYS